MARHTSKKDTKDAFLLKKDTQGYLCQHPHTSQDTPTHPHTHPHTPHTQLILLCQNYHGRLDDRVHICRKLEEHNEYHHKIYQK